MPYPSLFNPNKWFINQHIQTMGAKWLGRNLFVKTYGEILKLPDSDFTELAWTEKPAPNNTKPIVVLLHGLHGSKESHYIQSMFKAIKQKGWIGVLIHFRGCGDEPNRFPHSYHGGFTKDLDYFTLQLKSRYPSCDLGIIGYSLGGNVLANYLSEDNNASYKAAAIVSAPLDLASCTAKMNTGSSKVYQNYLLSMIKESIEEKIELNLITHISLDELKQISTIREFDEMITAPLHGFIDADDYYFQSSAKASLPKIDIPCLIIHAKDDPFICHESIIYKLPSLPHHITFEISEYGGHAGFISANKITKPHYWLETHIPKFLQDFL